MSSVRHLKKDSIPPQTCSKINLVEEVDRLTREVHTVTHQLSTITKRLFDLKEQIKKS